VVKFLKWLLLKKTKVILVDEGAIAIIIVGVLYMALMIAEMELIGTWFLAAPLVIFIYYAVGYTFIYEPIRDLWRECRASIEDGE
jgi:hypothetical protein